MYTWNQGGFEVVDWASETYIHSQDTKEVFDLVFVKPIYLALVQCDES